MLPLLRTEMLRYSGVGGRKIARNVLDIPLSIFIEDITVKAAHARVA